MPSFAFWKSSKPDDAKSPLLSDAAVKEELSVIIPNVSKAVDLNPGNQDSGVFLFDEDARELPGDQTPLIEPASDLAQEIQRGDTKVDNSLLDVEEPSLYPQSPALVPDEISHIEQSNISTEEDSGSATQENVEMVSQEDTPITEVESSDVPSPVEQKNDSCPRPQSRPVSLIPRESGPSLSIEKKPTLAALARVDTDLHGRDSGVYLSDNESSPVSSRPSSIVSNDNASPRSRVSSLSKPKSMSPQRTNSSTNSGTNSISRLQRPAELNLGFNSAVDPAKPKSELDMRYDLIRNSKTQSKAALRSPTQLLQERLNMSPKKKSKEDKLRVFTPPRATVNGCLLPGPSAQAEAFTSSSVRAKTEAGGRPAWWCKTDKLVVFDGIEQQADGELRPRTRTSKGLTVARRRGDLETVVIPLDCAHCHEMLNRHEWKYDMRVCSRSVCWDCKERCKWEFEQEKTAAAATPRADANRERADSMLQDEQSRSHNLQKGLVV